MIELSRVQLITQTPPVQWITYEELTEKKSIQTYTAIEYSLADALRRAADASNGFSGRSLRKIPFQAYACFSQV